MTEDGYLRTGDYVSVDKKGFIHVLDRKKDMIFVSGFNLFPNEIEVVVSQHAGAVESVPSALKVAMRGRWSNCLLSAKTTHRANKDIKNYCKEQLTGYKCPKVIEFIDEIPKSNVGKI